MTEPPLFEWSDEEEQVGRREHHPFTAPLDATTWTRRRRRRARYDLVLNGFELGGGSIRIHRPDLQRKVFEALGLSTEEIEEQFGHLIDGVPLRRAAARRASRSGSTGS